MLKFNRTTEYGLMAISYIREKRAGELASAREIADRFDLPFEILAKTLQRLKEQGIIASTYGTRGGYVLARDLTQLNLAEFVRIMEGPVSVVACAHKGPETEPAEQPCEYSGHCNISPMMRTLNDKLFDFLNSITVEELTRARLIEPAKAIAKAAASERADAVAFQGGEP